MPKKQTAVDLKKVSVFLQSKGGVGKSFLAYFKLLTLDPSQAAVVLLDSSQKANQNATRHASILSHEKVKVWDIYNNTNEYKKSHFFDVFEKIAELPASFIILDIGAPESNVLREGLATDEELTGENLKYIADELGLEIIFNVVVSGADDNVNENLNYFGAVNELLGRFFTVNMLLNDYTFKADGESETLKNELVADGVVNDSNIFIAGKSGSRNNDNPYLTIIKLANGELSMEEATKSMSTRIRVKNILQPLTTL